MQHFLPKTAHNISEYGGELEERYAPGLAEKHAIGNAHARMTWERLKESTKEGSDAAGKSMERFAGRFSELTGLKVQETLAWGTNVKKEVEAKTKVVEKVQSVGEAAQEKLAEAKEAVLHHQRNPGK